MTARFAAALLILLFPFSFCVAQEHAAAPSQPDAQPEKSQPEPARPAAAQGHDSAKPAAQGHGEEGGDPHAEFKYSPMVRKFAEMTGLSVESAYWLGMVINFAVMAAILFVVVTRSGIPTVLPPIASYFRERGEQILRAMEEARRASEDASARLAQIEGRLSRLNAEVAELRNASEAGAAAEDQRQQEAAHEDAARIVRTAEQEIDAAARLARRELRAYAAELAVSLAEKKIQVTPAADQELVRTFTDRLDQDGGQS